MLLTQERRDMTKSLLGQEHALLGQCLLYNPRMWPAEMTIESDHNADSASQQDSLLIGA